jgi:hypothetical protein
VVVSISPLFEVYQQHQVNKHSIALINPGLVIVFLLEFEQRPGLHYILILKLTRMKMILRRIGIVVSLLLLCGGRSLVGRSTVY